MPLVEPAATVADPPAVEELEDKALPACKVAVPGRPSSERRVLPAWICTRPALPVEALPAATVTAPAGECALADPLPTYTCPDLPAEVPDRSVTLPDPRAPGPESAEAIDTSPDVPRRLAPDDTATAPPSASWLLFVTPAAKLRLPPLPSSEGPAITATAAPSPDFVAPAKIEMLPALVWLFPVRRATLPEAEVAAAPDATST